MGPPSATGRRWSLSRGSRGEGGGGEGGGEARGGRGERRRSDRRRVRVRVRVRGAPEAKHKLQQVSVQSAKTGSTNFDHSRAPANGATRAERPTRRAERLLRPPATSGHCPARSIFGGSTAARSLEPLSWSLATEEVRRRRRRRRRVERILQRKFYYPLRVRSLGEQSRPAPSCRRPLRDTSWAEIDDARGTRRWEEEQAKSYSWSCSRQRETAGVDCLAVCKPFPVAPPTESQSDVRKKRQEEERVYFSSQRDKFATKSNRKMAKATRG